MVFSSVFFFDAHRARKLGDGAAPGNRGLRLLVAGDAGSDRVDVLHLAVNNDEGPVVLREKRQLLRDGNVGLFFVNDALGALVHDDAVVHHGGGIRLIDADRAAVELVHVDEVREEGLRERDVFAHHEGRPAERHPGNAAAHVLADHFLVGVEAPGRDHDAALRINVEGAFGL